MISGHVKRIQRNHTMLEAMITLITQADYVGPVGSAFCLFCLSVCLSVCVSLQHNSKTNDPTVFILGKGMILGYPRSDMALGLKGQRSRLVLGLGCSSSVYGFDV